jgi:hypothetical protein
MSWWGWIIAGAILLGSELAFVNAQFYLVFIGSAAIVVGLVTAVTPALASWAQWAEGDKQRVIKASEASKQQQINEADGQAAAILAVATATAEGLRKVGGALTERGGIEAMQLRIGEQYVRQFGKLAKESTTLIVPGNLSDLASVVTMATSIVRKPSPAQP